ncbi:MAG: DNA repair protein RecN [Candidatus Nanopelagicaceae bacterium]|nr:DNA repair protein RecN [Candidatus Nanopelagicaceae bacterium]
MGGVVSKKSASTRSHLQEITIRGLGVIDNAQVEFKPGLNVITGETGAGKTMLLTALNLILGGKADSDLVRTGQERLTTSGRFILPNPITPEISELLEENDVIIEEGEVLLNRNVAKDGKSRAMVSGISTTAAILHELSAHLIEVHGQHANQVLSKPAKQREVLDSYCDSEISTALQEYRAELEEYLSLKKQIEDLTKASRDKERLLSELSELDSEYRKLKPGKDELSELDNLIAKLGSIEELRIAATGASEALNHEEQGGLNSLQHSKKYLQAARGKDPYLDEIQERISEALFNLIDASGDLQRYLDSLEADPNALENALQRRSILLNFAKKYGTSTDRQVSYHEAIERGILAGERIKDLDGGDERIAQLANEVDKRRDVLLKCATRLTMIREAAAIKFAKQVEQELQVLAMPKAKLSVAVNSRTGQSDSDFQSFGLDEVQILFSAHSGGELLPIAKAASGGELSRLMLGIEVVIAHSYPVGTYIFDEVDAGVGGKAALDVGRRLKRLADEAQVIVVTHLPQVALWADHHIKVEKNSDGVVTESSIRAISDAERELEIARMLSGVEGSEHAQEHARELLNLRLAAKA